MARGTKRRRTRLLRFTREGRVFVLATVGLGAAAVNTGNNLMYLVLGLLLSSIVLSGLLSEVVLFRLKVRRRLPRRAFQGAPCLVELELENHKRGLASYSVELADVAEGEPDGTPVYALKVGAGGATVGTTRRTPSRRGRMTFTEVVVRTRFPFGLFEKTRRLRVEDELLVYPALVRPPPLDLERGVRGREVPLPRPGPGTEVAGLRDYVIGDEARSIHWRRTAALGRTVVRERQREVARRLVIDLDEARPPDADEAWDAAFEERISRAASLAGRALEEGAAVQVRCRASRSPLVMPGRPPDAIYRFLALLEPIEATASMPPLEAP